MDLTLVARTWFLFLFLPKSHAKTEFLIKVLVTLRQKRANGWGQCHFVSSVWCACFMFSKDSVLRQLNAPRLDESSFTQMVERQKELIRKEAEERQRGPLRPPQQVILSSPPAPHSSSSAETNGPAASVSPSAEGEAPPSLQTAAVGVGTGAPDGQDANGVSAQNEESTKPQE